MGNLYSRKNYKADVRWAILSADKIAQFYRPLDSGLRQALNCINTTTKSAMKHHVRHLRSSVLMSVL